MPNPGRKTTDPSSKIPFSSLFSLKTKDNHVKAAIFLTCLKRNFMKRWATIIIILLAVTSCTKETQNKIGRAVQNWTGTDGILDPGAKKVYFEFSDYSKSYIFYENPN